MKLTGAIKANPRIALAKFSISIDLSETDIDSEQMSLEQ